MESMLVVAATLSCPVGMGLMMWMMMRSHRSPHQTVGPVSDEIDELRAEIERLKAERETGSRSGVSDQGMARRNKPQRHGKLAPGA
jgi:hypothetical protein